MIRNFKTHVKILRYRNKKTTESIQLLQYQLSPQLLISWHLIRVHPHPVSLFCSVLFSFQFCVVSLLTSFDIFWLFHCPPKAAKADQSGARCQHGQAANSCAVVGGHDRGAPKRPPYRKSRLRAQSSTELKDRAQSSVRVRKTQKLQRPTKRSIVIFPSFKLSLAVASIFYIICPSFFVFFFSLSLSFSLWCGLFGLSMSVGNGPAIFWRLAFLNLWKAPSQKPAKFT